MNFYEMGSFILFNYKLHHLYTEGAKGGKEMAMYNPYQTNQFFPQPQGNVYMVNSSMETAGVPAGSGISVILCPNESLMFIKSMQNGTPTLLTYSLTLCETKTNKNSDERMRALEEEVAELKKQLKGGKLNNEL